MGKRRAIPVAAWEPRQAEKARAKLGLLLHGAGCEEDHWERGEVCLHRKRRLSGSELARLDPAWLALPAIDGAAPPGWPCTREEH